MGNCSAEFRRVVRPDLLDMLCTEPVASAWSGWWLWAGFTLLILVLLVATMWCAADLGKMIGEDLYNHNRRKREQQERESDERQEIIRLLRQLKGS